MRCGHCQQDCRTPQEKRRDDVLQSHGSGPEGYTPEVLGLLANGQIFDSSAAFCPAGRLTIAEVKAREAAQLTDNTDQPDPGP